MDKVFLWKRRIGTYRSKDEWKIMPADSRPKKDKSVKQTIGRQVASKGTLLPNAPGFNV